MRRSVVVSAALAVVLVSANASAQGLPRDAMGDDRRDAIAVEPLRLDLLSGFVPHRLSEPGCTDHPEATGTPTGMPGFPFQFLATKGIAFGRSWRAPRLTLSGFSRGGCAIDAALGGGATLLLPVRHDVFFAWSFGAIYLPHAGPGGGHEARSSARIDLTFQRPSGRAYMVGIGTTSGSPRVTFGGIF